MASSTADAPLRRKAAISFTGGKDSMTVLHMMRAPELVLAASAGWSSDAWRADVRERVAQVAGCEAALLVTFVPAGGHQSFKAHPLEVVRLQAQALGLPHLVLEVSPQPSFLESYRDNIRTLAEQHGVQVLATGDILDVCSSFMPRAAAGTGVELLSPLWGVERRLLLELVWAYGMAPLITCVNTTKFGGQREPRAPAVAPKGAPPADASIAVAEEKEEEEKRDRPAGQIQSAGQTRAELAAATRPKEDVGAGEEGRQAAAAAGTGAGTGEAEGAVCGASGRGVGSGAAGDVARGSAPPRDDKLQGCGGGGGDLGGEALLGKELDMELHEKALKPAAQKYGVDECGEWGEYHTMVLRSRLFAVPLSLSYEVRQEGEYAYLAVQKAELGLGPEGL